MVTDLGKISCTPRGDWVNSEEYDVLDIVRYTGAAYVALEKVPIGTLPTNITYWMKLVKDGTGATVDTAMSGTSENPVQNKVIKGYIDDELAKPEYRNMMVYIDNVGGNQYRADRRASEIRNFSNSGGTVQLSGTVNGRNLVLEYQGYDTGAVFKTSDVAANGVTGYIFKVLENKNIEITESLYSPPSLKWNE